MNDDVSAQLTSCDLEPIHVPGSIQPYGLMLIANSEGVVVGYAGAQTDVLDTSLEKLIGISVETITGKLTETGAAVIGVVPWQGARRDAVAYRSGEHLVVELLEQTDDGQLDARFLAEMELLDATLDRSVSLGDLCRQAARIFQDLTGYSRVMIYQFVDDEAGVVLGEAIAGGASSFMNHHFPASDIPRQARALYVRNRVRVIEDVNYVPAPVISASSDLSAIDMSDSTLRSVSPIHIQYLKNMGVAASASMSIIKDGILWGLVACHHDAPRNLSLTTRLATQAVAAKLASQIKAREDKELFQERIRLRSQEDLVLGRLGDDESLEAFFKKSAAELATLLQATGFAAIQGEDIFTSGKCPDPIDIRTIAEHVRRPAAIKPFVTSHLSSGLPAAGHVTSLASGLLAVTMSTELPTILMWFRAEKLQTVKWAGNPHEGAKHSPGEVLSPRSSFEAWSESVKGRSTPWSLAETESANRVVKMMLDARNNRRMRALNKELATTIRENETLLQQKDFLLREVNHRVQNSLSLVSAFLRLQSRSVPDDVREHLEQADHRLMAVGLVHRRLYQDDSVEIIDLSRYLAELISELKTSLDQRWGSQMELGLTPMLISTDRAVSVGLIVNELLINATKYAYAEPGPIRIVLEQHRSTLRLIVSDQGKGRSGKTEGTGFGSRMLASLVQRLGGTLTYEDNRPGVRAVVTASIQGEPEPGS